MNDPTYKALCDAQDRIRCLEAELVTATKKLHKIYKEYDEEVISHDLEEKDLRRRLSNAEDILPRISQFVAQRIGAEAMKEHQGNLADVVVDFMKSQERTIASLSAALADAEMGCSSD